MVCLYVKYTQKIYTYSTHSTSCELLITLY